MSEYPEIGRWRIYGAKGNGVTYYQGKDTPPDVWVVPCDEEAISRAVAELENWPWRTGSLTIGDRMLVEAVLKAASGR